MTWSVGDSDMIRVDGEGMVSVREDARWIADLIQAEKTANSNSPYAKSEAAGNRSSYVTVTTADGGKQAVCAVNVSFRTVDNTVAHVESVSLDQQELTFEIEKVMTGRRSNPTVEYKVTSPVQLNAAVYPAEAENRSVAWSVDDGDVLTVSESGMVTARTDGQWIKDLETANLYGAAGEKTALVTVTTADGGKQAQCKVSVSFKTTNNTTSSSSGGSSGGGGGGSSSGGSSSAVAQVRTYASPYADIRATLENGTKVAIIKKVTGEDGQEWTKISFTQNGSQLEGYVPSSLLK